MASMALARATAVAKNAIGISTAGSFSEIGYDLSKYVSPSGERNCLYPEALKTTSSSSTASHSQVRTYPRARNAAFLFLVNVGEW
ncbi:hypothetical protein CGLO_16256 [Colletotrichum gloeosporioides Cg-14]|uniref:Uncharacterized protein n=1 Tax=Colletotrichum gloeosporioides (strain Cg-14) TaxID=1237896 RepID=T0JX22_COLGC|nr:hypothetical protein CGLO_16256 [Colletotrichum gloeosporioides Cg-14]